MNNIKPEFSELIRQAFYKKQNLCAGPKKSVFKFFGTVKELKKLFNL